MARKKTNIKPNRLRNKCVQVRCTDEEYEKMSRNANAARLSLSEYVRKITLLHNPKALPPEEFYEIKDLLKDFKQKYEANSNFFFGKSEVRRIEECIEHFDERVNRFYEEARDGDN